MSLKRFPIRYAVFLMAYYMANAIYQSYISLFYESKGFSSAQIGGICAAVALASIAAQPCWGICGDRMKSRNRLLRLLALGASVSALFLLQASRFLPVLLLACLFSIFYTSIQPMGDSIVLAALNKEGLPFGPVRLSGGITFAIASLIFGRLLGEGQERWIVICTAIMCMLIIPATLGLPKTPGYQSSGGGGKRMSFGALMKQKELMCLMLFMLPIQITMGYFYTFFSPMFVTLQGGSSTLLGWCYFISALSEIPYLLLSDKLFERFGAGKLMCVSAAALTVRWIIVAMSSSVVPVMISQVLHGWGFIVMTVSMAKYISRTVPQELQASGQMLLAIVSYGMARAAGNLGGGLLADVFGPQNIFFLCAGVCAAALCVFFPRYMRAKPVN